MFMWQVAFLLLGTSWLWAPHLNKLLSPRTALISQYEMPLQPFSWLFRLSDLLSASLLLFITYISYKLKRNKTVMVLLLLIGIGMLLDPVLTTSCHVSAASCQEYFSLNFFLHASETVLTATSLMLLSLYDIYKRKRVVSLLFVAFQIAYGLLFISQLADQQHFNTFSQFLYQTIIILWLAWFVRDFLLDRNVRPKLRESSIVKSLAATAAYIGGITSILASLAHIHLLGRIRNFYFGGDTAWLAQHSVIIGIVMLYLARHLARGELRARQIFLAIAGLETLKYSVIAPHPSLMVFYLIVFITLFLAKDDFKRGTVPMTWDVRLKDLVYMFISLSATLLVALIVLDRDNRTALATSRAFDHFFDYAATNPVVMRTHLPSILLAHTASVFLMLSVATGLYILFRPYNRVVKNTAASKDRIEQALRRYSNSSEDCFKLWPNDKEYFFGDSEDGFIAYKVVGSIAFALTDPMAKERSKLIAQFIAWCGAHRLRACFLPISKQSLTMYKQQSLKTLDIGASALINIRNFVNTTSNDKWWRWQKNRAAKNNYIYKHAIPPHNQDLLKQFRRVSDSWLTINDHKERGFALGYFKEEYIQKCIINYLETKDGRVCAFVNELPQFKSSNVLAIDLLRYHADSPSAMPYLLYKTIEANQDNYTEFDLGFVPFAQTKSSVLSVARALAGNRFSSKGLEQFKNKFDPVWYPMYLAYDGDLGDLTLIALKLEDATKVM